MANTQNVLQRQLADLITRCAHLNEIRLLIAQGAKVNIPVTQGLRPLHYSVYSNYAECVELLIIRGAELNQIDEIGFTPLHLAAEKGYIEILKILIKAGAKVCFTEKNLISQVEEPLRLAIKSDHFECAKLLLENKANPNAVYFLGSELNFAANQPGKNLKYIELLLKAGARTEIRNRSGLTPIMQVASVNYEATKLLLKSNSETSCYAPENEDFRSVLHYAVKSGNYSLLRLLLFCGANPVYPCEILKKPSSLGFAIIKGDLNMVKLLIEFGAQLNTGCPLVGLPLHIALSKKIKNRKEILLTLFANGADPNLITMDNKNPCLKPPLGEYFNNIEEPEIEIVRLLLKYGSRCIISAQVQHPLGILKCLNKLHLNNLEDSLDRQVQLDQLDQVELNEQLAIEGDKRAQLFNLLINSCELFNIQAIKRCTLLNQNQKRLLLHYSIQPIKLKNLSRLSLRRYVFQFSQQFFTDEQNASSAYYALDNNKLNQQQLPELRSKSFDYNTSGDLVMGRHDLLNDSYLYNKNAYKKYVGNRYQKCVNRIEDKLFYKPSTRQHLDNLIDDKVIFNQELAIQYGLTSEEMEVVKLRHEFQLNEQKQSELQLNKFKRFNDDNLTIESRLSNRNIAMLPLGFRVPPGCNWPTKLIDLDSKFNDYNFKYYSSLNSASTFIDQLREYFNFDENCFKCSASFAVHILNHLPMPIYLRKYVQYEED